MKDCNSCGKCCVKYSKGGLNASQFDLETWETLHPDIHKYVYDGAIWMDPDSHTQLDLCPWLRKGHEHATYHCAIYYDRPEDCRIYPVTINDMIVDECEMLQPQDLIDLKQAQKTLDAMYKL